MSELPLCGPPSYEYRTTGPWWVCHLNPAGRTQAFTVWTFEAAISRFWFVPQDDTIPPRRVMVDALGITILGCQRGERPGMVGTRQTMEATLGLVRRSGMMLESEVQILEMAETLRSFDGTACS